MGVNGETSLGRGVLAGVVSGLVGSWVMMRFMEGPGQRLQAGRAGQPPDGAAGEDRSDVEDNVTMKAADKFVSAATGGRPLTHEARVQGGVAVHYAFGAVMGGVYGATSEYTALPGIAMGSAFGTVLWSATDLLAIPAVGFTVPPSDEPGRAHAAHWMAHVVYGMSMELSRRGVRRLLRG